MDEIEIWEYLLKWSFAQQNIQKNPTEWNKDDITRIERELHRFIPFIQFYDIEPTDFFYKVYCYKEILPPNLIHDLLEYHIVPNVKPKVNLPNSRKINSTLIESKHIPLFSSWIGRKESSYYDRKSCPYDFKLLYRSSRDGIDTKTFHNNCDNKGATIWVAKIKDSTQLIGGYNPLDWNGNSGYKAANDSFLFNFTNGRNISTAKLGYVNKTNVAVYCEYNYGPSMGNLFCKNNRWYTNSSDNGDRYPRIGIPESLM